MANVSRIYTGTSGLVTPVPRDLYPPEFQGKSRLEFYASLYNSIEINSSFYKLPMAATVKKWDALVPDGFRFTFKLSKTITHVKALDFNPDDVIQFMRRIEIQAHKKGCILIQFPPSQQQHIMKLREILTLIKQEDVNEDWCIAIEFRHKTWYQENVYRLLESFNAAMVIHDIPASAPPADEYESDTMYLRFHGPEGRYRGSYEDDFLQEYAGYIKDWENAGKTVYVYFNNTMGDAIANLNTLRSHL